VTGNLINEQLKQLPANPGVYLMKDTAGKIIYVGKAGNLSNRVRSYFQPSAKLEPKTQQQVAEAKELEFFITNSEYEALIVENNLIKRYHPFYNIRLKDDKGYPYIKINLKEDWSTVSYTREMKNDGARYFGPFTSPWSVKQTLKVLESIFGFRSCSKPITGTDKRPCLKYHLGHCLAPCTGYVSKEEYKEAIKQIVLFLEGKRDRVIKEFEQEMKAASEALDFERAAQLRDRIGAIRNVIEGQKIAAKVSGNEDAIAFVTDKDQAYVQVFFVRSGKLIGRESFVLTGTNAEQPQEIMASFIKQYYNSATVIAVPHRRQRCHRELAEAKKKRSGNDFRSETGQQKGTGPDCRTKRGAGFETNEGQAICRAGNDGIRIERNTGKTRTAVPAGTDGML
jgi:excinuclease ABC subunit C